MDANLEENKTKNNKIVFWLIIFLTSAVVAYSVYYIFYLNSDTYKTDMTMKQLDALSESSEPVTKTPEEKMKDLEALKKSSAPIKYTTEEKLEMLKSLEQ